jgi:hypothetical protein
MKTESEKNLGEIPYGMEAFVSGVMFPAGYCAAWIKWTGFDLMGVLIEGRRWGRRRMGTGWVRLALSIGKIRREREVCDFMDHGMSMAGLRHDEAYGRLHHPLNTHTHTHI